MQKPLLILILLPISGTARACITCNEQIRQAIWSSTFYPNLLTMLSAFIVLAVLVAILSAINGRRHTATLARYPGSSLLNPVPLTTAATVLGIGLGGFIDGIALHQILQWHEMLSNKLPPVDFVTKSINMFWDGVFHAFCLLVTLIGCILLWRLVGRSDVDRSARLFRGGLLLGWALFNLVEGLIDHHLLKLHNVREITSNPAAWNFGFLALSLLMLLLALLLLNKKGPRAS